MSKKQRLEQIEKIVNRRGTIEISKLGETFGVTQMTIRRDLDELEAEGKIIRTRGGAMINNQDALRESPVYLRMNERSALKERLGEKAAMQLRDGQKVLIGSGSTICPFARMVDNTCRLIVVTQSLDIALELSTRSNISIIIIGGELRSNTLSTSGTMADQSLAHFRFDNSFLGVTAIDAEGRLYDRSLIEQGLYGQIRDLSPRITIIADSSKIGQTDFVQVGQLEKGDILVTDDGIDPEIKKGFEERGIVIRMAASSAPEDEKDELTEKYHD